MAADSEQYLRDIIELLHSRTGAAEARVAPLAAEREQLVADKARLEARLAVVPALQDEQVALAATLAEAQERLARAQQNIEALNAVVLVTGRSLGDLMDKVGQLTQEAEAVAVTR